MKSKVEKEGMLKSAYMTLEFIMRDLSQNGYDEFMILIDMQRIIDRLKVMYNEVEDD